jgi:hypothetical protein
METQECNNKIRPLQSSTIFMLCRSKISLSSLVSTALPQLKGSSINSLQPSLSTMPPIIAKSEVNSILEFPSICSEDQVSEANTTGTRIHHRSKMQPISKDPTPEHDWEFGRAAAITPASHWSKASADSNFDQLEVECPFVKADEAKQTGQDYMKQITASNNARNDVLHHLGLPLYRD